MSRRNRYSDTRSAGRSDVAPFQAGYAATDRHRDRLETALAFQEQVEVWCQHRGFVLKVANQGHHWKLMGPFLAEWWPSSAKLVFDKKYDRGIHCHDVEQLATLIGKRLDAKQNRGN